MDDTYKRRAGDHVLIPKWLATVLLGAIITASGIGGGVYVKSIAADEAKALDKTHTDHAVRRFDRIDTYVNQHEIELKLLKTDLTYIKKVAEKADLNSGRNHNILIRIATKLDVDIE